MAEQTGDVPSDGGKNGPELKQKLGNLFDWGTWRHMTRGDDIAGSYDYDIVNAPHDSLLTGYLVPYSDITAGMVAKGKVDVAHEMIQRSVCHGVGPSCKHIWVGEGRPEDIGIKSGHWRFNPPVGKARLPWVLVNRPVSITSTMAFYSIFVKAPVAGEVWLQVGSGGASVRGVYPLASLGIDGVPSLAYLSRPVFYEPNENLYITYRPAECDGDGYTPVEIGFGFLVSKPLGVSVSDVT